MFKKLIGPAVLAAVLPLVAGLAAAPAAAQGKVSVPLLLSPAGSGPVEGDTILMIQMIKEGTPVTLLPRARVPFWLTTAHRWRTAREASVPVGSSVGAIASGDRPSCSSASGRGAVES